MKKSNVFLISLLVALLVLTFLITGCKKTEIREEKTPELRLVFGIVTDDHTLIDFADRYALESDIFAFRYALIKENPDLTKAISRSKKMVIASSIKTFEENVDLINNIDATYLGYNIESGSGEETSALEKADPVAAVKAMYDFAHENEFKLMVGTNSQWLEDPNIGVKMAQYADIFLIQCGAIQIDNPLKVCKKPITESCTTEENLEYFENECRRLVKIIRNANPDIPIFIQIQTGPWPPKPGDRERPWLRALTIEEMIADTNLISNSVDGIIISYTTPDTIDVWKQYIQWIRTE